MGLPYRHNIYSKPLLYGALISESDGQRGFGDVYQGTIRGGVGIYKSNGPPIMRVAVKILRGTYVCIFASYCKCTQY